MRLSRRLLSSLVGVAAALAVLAALGWAFSRDADRFRPWFESAASRAFGMQVRVGGPLRLSLGASPCISVEDVRILDARHAVVGSAKRARFWVEPVALFGGHVRLRRLELVQPSITVERERNGRFNVGDLARLAPLLGALDGASVLLTDGTLRYADATSGAKLAADGVGVSVSRLRFADRDRPWRVPGMVLEARLSCASIRTQACTLTAVSTVASGRDGVIELDPIGLRVFGGRASGRLRVDAAGAKTRYALRCSLVGFRIEQFLGTLPGQPTVRGPMDFSARLTMAGLTRAQLVRTSAGTVSLRGRQLTLVGDDLDRRLSRFESSQKFSFVDVGAAVLAGPIGLAATRGGSILGLFRGSGGSSSIGVLASDWAIDGGIARAADVALATRRHRLALQGSIDFVNGRFVDVSVAAIGPGGCATVRQAMHGSFLHPVLEKPRMLNSLAGPVLHVYRQLRRILPASPCVVFYSGSVPPPG